MAALDDIDVSEWEEENAAAVIQDLKEQLAATRHVVRIHRRLLRQQRVTIGRLTLRLLGEQGKNQTLRAAYLEQRNARDRRSNE